MKRLTDRKVAEQVRQNIEKLSEKGVEPSILDVRYVRLAEYENEEEDRCIHGEHEEWYE